MKLGCGSNRKWYVLSTPKNIFHIGEDHDQSSPSIVEVFLMWLGIEGDLRFSNQADFLMLQMTRCLLVPPKGYHTY